MNRLIKGFTVLLLVFVTACSGGHSGPLSAFEYIRYIEAEKNQFKTAVTSGMLTYDFQYKPAAYIALKEQEPGNIKKSDIPARISGLYKTVWFNVTIHVTGKSTDPLKYEIRDQNEYNTRLDYFLNRAAGNFHLIYGNNEMKQAGYYFENNYSIKPDIVLIIGFHIPDDQPRESVTLDYQDELFNTGIMKFHISQSAFATIPQLSL